MCKLAMSTFWPLSSYERLSYHWLNSGNQPKLVTKISVSGQQRLPKKEHVHLSDGTFKKIQEELDAHIKLGHVPRISSFMKSICKLSYLMLSLKHRFQVSCEQSKQYFIIKTNTSPNSVDFFTIVFINSICKEMTLDRKRDAFIPHVKCWSLP